MSACHKETNPKGDERGGLLHPVPSPGKARQAGFPCCDAAISSVHDVDYAFGNSGLAVPFGRQAGLRRGHKETANENPAEQNHA